MVVKELGMDIFLSPKVIFNGDAEREAEKVNTLLSEYIKDHNISRIMVNSRLFIDQKQYDAPAFRVTESPNVKIVPEDNVSAETLCDNFGMQVYSGEELLFVKRLFSLPDQEDAWVRISCKDGEMTVTTRDFPQCIYE